MSPDGKASIAFSSVMSTQSLRPDSSLHRIAVQTKAVMNPPKEHRTPVPIKPSAIKVASPFSESNN